MKETRDEDWHALGAGQDGGPSLLAVSDLPEAQEELATLAGGTFKVCVAALAEAMDALWSGKHEVLVLDGSVPKERALRLLGWARHRRPWTARVLLTRPEEAEEAAATLADGALDACVLRPLTPEGLLPVLQAAARMARWLRTHAPVQEGVERSVGRLWAQFLKQNRLLARSAELLARRVEELEQEAARLRRLALVLESRSLTDWLTGLPNRRAVEAVAEDEVRRRARHPAALTIGIIDADHFKEINQAHLLPGGDAALVGLARAVRSAIRGTDRVGRIGGEELLLVCPQTDLGGAVALAERVRAAVEEARIDFAGRVIPLTVSIGMAVAEVGQPADLNSLRNLAAENLAQAKQSGRNCCIVRGLAAEAVAGSGG
jgi:diguanylate cyclase (GGDEF)-like protein